MRFRALITQLCLVLLLPKLSGCASAPNVESMDEVFRYQVLFTVSQKLNTSLTKGETDAPAQARDSEKSQHDALINSVIKVHRLNKIAQWPLNALGLEAIVAEFSSDREVEEVIAALSADARVESVQSVNTYELLSYNDPYFHLQSSIPRSNLESVHEVVTGKHVTVGIVDTGIDREHPELAGRVTFSANFVDHDQGTFDADEHGTTVAGVIGSAANNELGIVGVAPDINLKVFKACAQKSLSRRATCDSFSLMKALAEVLRQQPDVLNLSLAGAPDPLLARLIEAALQRGVVVVAAVDHRKAEYSFPASIEGVIAVSSSLQFTHDWMPSSGVLAPGTEVLTTTPGATYAFRSGSSMSTAFVSGVAALMKERDPKINSAELNRLLHSTALARINKVPMVDVCRLVRSTVTDSVGVSTRADMCNRDAALAADTQLGERKQLP